MLGLLGLSVLSALAAAVMAIAHLGIRVPVISALGPQGTDAVPPAVAAFSLAAVLFTVIAVGVAGSRTWAWPVGIVVNGVALVAAAVPYRGVGSLAGILVSATALALLLSPPVRRTLMPSR